MRRHLALALGLVLVASAATAAVVTTAGADTAAPAAKPHIVVKIVGGAKCKPASEYCFKPALASVASGTKVTWKNTTIAPHTVTRCSTLHCSGVSGGTGTDTGLGSPSSITPGTKYSFVFHGKGTYTYYCQVHGYGVMHGTITVT